MRDPDIAILIPCYNEEKTIGTVIQDFAKYIPDARIYVFDNNSTDRSYQIAKSYENTCNLLVVKSGDQGKGNVVKHMLTLIDADVYLMTDADTTYHANEAYKLIEPVLSGEYDMAIGDRLSDCYDQTDVRLFHSFGNKLVRFLINFLYHGNLNDIMTGYRAFNRTFANQFKSKIKSKNFEIETEMSAYALKNKFKIYQIPIEYTDRPDGSKSKVSTIKDGVKIIFMILRMLF